MKKLIVKIGLPAVLIAAACSIVLATHWPALSAGAMFFDDQQYVTANTLVQNPGWASSKRFLTEIFKPSTVGGYYQPLTMISLMLDYALGGREDNLLPFHRTSLALHTANTALVIVLLYLLFGNIWAAAAAGLLFGVHPMTVETIPWLSERKTLLSAFFAFWSLVSYVRFCRTNSRKYYAAAFFAYLLALMSKPTSVPLPFVMLLMDYWPLNRFSRRAVIEKLPFFALALVFAIITLVSQMSAGGGSLPGQQEHGLQNPPLTVCYDMVFYLCKIFWPANVSSFYAYPQPFAISNPRVLAGVVGSAFLIVLLLVSRRWTRAILSGVLIFLVAILPTMQIFRFSSVIASNKFAYLPSIGLLMILTSFLLWLYNARLSRAIGIAVVILSLTAAEAVGARRYLAYWGDSITLHKYTLSLAPDSAPLYGNLAYAYGRLGRHEEAIETLRQVTAIDPYDGMAYFNLGVAYLNLNRYQQAVSALEKAIQFMPDYAEAYNNLAFVYGALGRFAEEIDLCNQAIKLKPDSVEAYVTLGSAYGNLGRYPEALETYKQAVKISPKNPQSRFGLGVAYLKNGDTTSALQQYEILTQLDPNLADHLHALIQN